MSEEPSESRPKYRRVILKISGESFGPAGERGISMEEVVTIAEQIHQAAKLGVEIGIVIGGGNILRGASFSARSSSIKNGTADYMGMLATVMNGLALQDALDSLHCDTRLMTALRMDAVAEPYIGRKAMRYLEKKNVVIIAGGTGGPFVTTDTAAALRALELEAEVLLKATNVEGVYNDDPKKNPHAVKVDHLSFQTVLEQHLQVMDSMAIAQCMDHRLPILVFNFKKAGNIVRAVMGESVGSLIDVNGPK